MTSNMGDMDPSILRRISELTNAYCPEFGNAFGTPDLVAQKFAILGNYIPVELRAALQEELQSLPDGPIFESICLTQEQKEEFDNDRRNILTDRGLDEKTATRMINNANDRVLKDLGDLSKLAEKGTDGLLGDA